MRNKLVLLWFVLLLAGCTPVLDWHVRVEVVYLTPTPAGATPASPTPTSTFTPTPDATIGPPGTVIPSPGPTTPVPATATPTASPTPPQAPTATPFPTPTQERVYFTTDRLNLRTGPGQAYTRITVLDPDVPVFLLSEPVASPDDVYTWVKVETPGGAQGWVAMEYLR